MAKKNEQTGAEDQAPVENKSAHPAPDALVERHAKLRQERRVLEAELAVIDGQIREAINAGDVAALESRTARKAELPKLFVAASVAETTERQRIFNAEDAANLKLLQAAQGKYREAEAALLKRQVEVEAEIAAMKDKLRDAENAVQAVYTAIRGSRELGAIGEAGFRRALAALGV